MKYYCGGLLSCFLFFVVCSVHAHETNMRYNRNCLHKELRGQPDQIECTIFPKKRPFTFAHVNATPTTGIVVNTELFNAWRLYILTKMQNVLVTLTHKLDSKNDGDNIVTYEAQQRAFRQYVHLRDALYVPIDNDSVVVPEQDLTLLAHWSDEVIIKVDEGVLQVIVVLDAGRQLLIEPCCGELAQLLKDHAYWNEVVESGWAAFDQDPTGRLQPVLHTNVIGEKFHFYKTAFGPFFRETLSEQERAPGDLYRIVKYVNRDPRLSTEVHGSLDIIWLKFPADPDYDPSLNGWYNPGKQHEDDSTPGKFANQATWAYEKDALALFIQQR
jgi:hypothetical protein